VKKNGRPAKAKSAVGTPAKSAAISATALSELPAVASPVYTTAPAEAFPQAPPPPASTKGLVAGAAFAALLVVASAVPTSALAGLSPQALAQLGYARSGIAVLGAIALIVICVMLAKRISAAGVSAAAYAHEVAARTAKMQDASNDLAAAAARTDRIMETVTQGLFLLDPTYRIEGQYSRQTDAIFRSADLEGVNVLELLQKMLTERMYQITRDYFALLFDPTKKERTVLRVNPLLQVEVNFPNPEGGYISRFLTFAFRRIVAGGVVTQVFVAVDDITKRVELETQIRDSETTKSRQFEFLLGVMHVSPKDLDEFIIGAQEQLSIMNTALRTQDFSTAGPGQMNIFKQRLATVFRAVHTLKGSAQTLKLQHFVDLCHAFEDKVSALRSKMNLVGDDFLSVVIAQSEITKDIEELSDVRVRFLSLRTTQTSQPLERRATDLLTSIANLIESSAEKQRKKARLEALGFEITRLPDDIRRIVRDIVIQLSRNSITHGVESPEDRLELGKLPVATITIAAKTDAPPDTFAFTFRDDGRGLDPAGIKESAMKKGILNAEEAAAMSPAEAIGLIFRPGFSTATEVTEDAGRGFGMNIVKEMVVDRLGGKVSLKSEPTRFTEFSISIPLTPQVVPSDGAVRELLPV